MSTVTVLAQPATDDSEGVEEHIVPETLLNISDENKAHLNAENKAIHMLLTGIRNEIYSTVDACKTSNEMWIAIYQKEVNKLHTEKIARNANHLALVAAAQQYPDPYYQASKPQRSYAHAPKQHSSTGPTISTKHKGKEIAKPITPLSESASEEDIDPKQAQKDKEMQKNLALIAKYFNKLYKPTKNNLRTSSNSRNKNVDTSPRYVKDNQTGQFRNQRTVTVAGARETIGNQVEQVDWLEDTNEEVDE
ncbi:hypothetical protein Tco_0058185 [Tanacetum coccineum]